MFSNAFPMRRRAAVGLVAAAVVVASLTACSAPKSSSSTALTHNSKSTLLVWTDSVREPGFKKFQSTHPSIKMKIETYDATALLAKIQLFNRTGSGWPDVIFTPGSAQVAALATKKFKNFPLALNSAVPASVQKNFGTTNGVCTVGTNLDCLRNDIAPTVLWYNKTLMSQWGYSVPKTWAAYEALGLKVAADHPGYVLGAGGGGEAYYNYFAPSGCPLADVTSSTSVHINTSDPACTRVADMLDKLIAAGSVSKLGVVDPAYIALASQGKVLMMPGAAFYGQFLYQPKAVYNVEPGVTAAAPIPSWTSGGATTTGDAGGGAYIVSSHSKNEVGAVAIAQWMATNNTYQSTEPSYPAYGPAAQAWSKNVAADTFFASNPFPVMQEMIPLITKVQSKAVSFDYVTAFTQTVGQAVGAGKPITSALSTLQSQLTQLAQADGYTVVAK